MVEGSGQAHRIIESLTGMMDSERFRKLHWEGTFEDYISMVVRTPRLARHILSTPVRHDHVVRL